jgi:hypothetical protein
LKRRMGIRSVVLLAVSAGALVFASAANAAVVGSKPIAGWQANNTVRVEVVSGNIAYIGGQFTSLFPAGSNGTTGAVTRDGAAAINLDTGQLLPWNPNVTGGTVYAIEVDPNTGNVFLGGSFATVGGVTHKKIVEVGNALSNGTGSVITTFKPPVPNGAVRGFNVLGSQLYIGGAFTKLGSTARGYIARVSDTTGAFDSTWVPVVDAEVHAIAFDTAGTRVVLGGFFRSVNGDTTLIGVGAVDTVTGTTNEPWAWHTSDLQTFRPFQILRFTQDGNTLFAAGTGNGGEMLSFDITTGNLNYVAGTNGNVVDMAVMDGIVYFGGHFSQYCGLTPGNNFCTPVAARDKLVALDETTGALESWHPAVNTNLGIEAMAAGDSQLLIGGEFTKAGGVAQQRIAQFHE